MHRRLAGKSVHERPGSVSGVSRGKCDLLKRSQDSYPERPNGAVRQGRRGEQRGGARQGGRGSSSRRRDLLVVNDRYRRTRRRDTGKASRHGIRGTRIGRRTFSGGTPVLSDGSGNVYAAGDAGGAGFVENTFGGARPRVRGDW